MPTATGSNSTSPIYNGVNKIASIYKGTELVYSGGGSDTIGDFIKPFVIPYSYNTNVEYSFTSPPTGGAPYLIDVLSSGNYYMAGDYTGRAGGVSLPKALTDTSTNDSLTTLYIPTSYNNKEVVKLCTYSFYDIQTLYPNLEHIIIGEGIENIGYSSFFSISTKARASKDKRKIILPNSLKNIEPLAFCGCRIYKVDCSKLTFFQGNQTDKNSNNQAAFQYCIIDEAIATGDSYFGRDFSGTSPNSPFGVTGGNVFKNLKIKDLSRLGTNSFNGCTANKISFDDKLIEIANNAFNQGKLKGDVKFPKNIQIFGANSLPIYEANSLKFEHSNSDTITFNLDSSNHGPFYYKTAYNMTVYTDNDYIKNHDWSTYENATVTFYHLDGTPWE